MEAFLRYDFLFVLIFLLLSLISMFFSIGVDLIRILRRIADISTLIVHIERAERMQVEENNRNLEAVLAMMKEREKNE